MCCVANSFIFASRGSRGGSFLSVVDPEGFYVIMSLAHSISSSFYMIQLYIQVQVNNSTNFKQSFPQNFPLQTMKNAANNASRFNFSILACIRFNHI